MSQMIIREARLSPDDIEPLADLVEEFHNESLKEYKITYDRTTICHSIHQLIKDHLMLVALKQDKVIGVIGGIIQPSIFNNQQIIAQEIIWYITKTERGGMAGIKMVQAFEKACKERGASLVMMIHMSNLSSEILSKFYWSNGYQNMETHYVKEVT